MANQVKYALDFKQCNSSKLPLSYEYSYRGHTFKLSRKGFGFPGWYISQETFQIDVDRFTNRTDAINYCTKLVNNSIEQEKKPWSLETKFGLN